MELNGLGSLSDQDLESNLKSLVRKERALLHLILEHIREVDTRKIYLERAYSSMYDYLTKELGYSGAAAVRRLEAARLMKVIPSLATKIQDGSINLSQVGEFARALKQKQKEGGQVSVEDKAEILEQVSGLNLEQTQKVVSKSLNLELQEPERVRVQKDDSVHLSLTLSHKQFEILKRCRDQAAHLLQLKGGDHSWVRVIELLAEQFLDNKNGFVSKVNDRVLDESGSLASVRRENKTLTPKTRKMVLLRDQRCQFQDKQTGKICGSTYGLQVDHISPRWAGGNHSAKNLQALCWSHNQAKYRAEARIRLR